MHSVCKNSMSRYELWTVELHVQRSSRALSSQSSSMQCLPQIDNIYHETMLKDELAWHDEKTCTRNKALARVAAAQTVDFRC